MKKTLLSMLFLAVATTAIARADEGMWPYTAPPREALKARHHFEAPAAWYEHLQKASVRFNNGGSGSFISADGLIMTNHHVGADTLHKLSSPGHDLFRDGFASRARAEEKPCPDLELKFFRDVRLPFMLNWLCRMEVAFKTFAERSDDNARQAQTALKGLQNSRKAYLGRLEGLQDPAIMKIKADQEQQLRRQVGANPELARRYGDAWERW